MTILVAAGQHHFAHIFRHFAQEWDALIGLRYYSVRLEAGGFRHRYNGEASLKLWGGGGGTIVRAALLPVVLFV
jgi:hypothetical protein